MLVKLYALRQPLVSRHTSEVLAAVAGNSSSHLGTAQLAQLLGMLIDGEASQLLSGRVFGAGHSWLWLRACWGCGLPWRVLVKAKVLDGLLVRLWAC